MRYEIETKKYSMFSGSREDNLKARIIADSDCLVAYGVADLKEKLMFLRHHRIVVENVYKVKESDCTYTNVSDKYLTKPELSYMSYQLVNGQRRY